jgi:hypothetical protein
MALKKVLRAHDLKKRMVFRLELMKAGSDQRMIK